MKSNIGFTKRIISVVLCFVLLLSCIPLTVLSADNSTDAYYNRIVDANTMDNWKKYFDLDNLDTSNSGGVWTDKSVFKDASVFDNKITMLDDDKNFLTALSAIAANKEIVGYSTIPTDTVLVLDLSGSMENSNSESDLIDAANDAIGKLLKENENNRVGVVLYSADDETGTSTYSESVTRILPIDRYTTGNDGKYLNLNWYGTVSVDNDVTGTKNFTKVSKTFGGGTYIQAGLWEAWKMFESMDTVIGENNWQSGDDRMPILVLMSDGAPSTGTTSYADVGGSNVGNGNESGLTAGNAFLTQLTASYVMNRIEGHYQQRNKDIRGLFYTLGFNIGNNNVAKSVMNPDSSTFTDSLWTAYNNLTDGSLAINVKNTRGNYSDVTITKNSYVTNKSYVDQYFSASDDGLANAFKSIVDEIILQSRYYPTHLEGGSPDFSGYIEFTDTLGEYMEVKHINGILLGDTLFDGHMMASKLADNSENGLGTTDNPTELGDEFIRSIKTRLGITNTEDAQTLVARAFNAGQLKYNSAADWSNYIGWYAKANGTYAGFWDENSTEAAPADAVYKIKSYGFLGKTTGSIKNSDMMYMSVQVRTNISTSEQTLLWKIPAALVPMVTYLVTLEGTNVDKAKNVTIKVENAEDVAPIRLIFESGLRSDLNELNITRITDNKHIAADGVTRQFWNNYFDISSNVHEEHITAISKFTPSKENERFYYTFDSAVHKKVGENYVLVSENEGTSGKLNKNGEYYHRRYVFTENSTIPVFRYEKMSSSSIESAVWDANFKTLTGQTGAYVVKSGTPARELQMYSELKADEDATKSAHMIFYPYLTEHNGTFYVDMNLGNNGLLEVTPAQGIKLSKTIDVYETGTSTDFSFLITAHNSDGTPYTGKANSWKTTLDTVPTGSPDEITFTHQGTYTVNLSANQTLWLSGLPTGATYTIEEISENADYKVKSVHVNGVSTGNVAAGTIAAYFIDDVDFVNTAIGEGDLVITKQVIDANGNTVDVSDSVQFTAEVTLTNSSNAPVSGSFESSKGTLTVPANGKFTVTLKEGESFVVRNIPEGTRYSVTEINIPTGFTINNEKSKLQGVIDAIGNDQALIVNSYTPTGTDGSDIDVVINKQISGNRTEWINNESYTFTLEQIGLSRDSKVVAAATIDYNDAQKSHTFNLSGEDYDAAGTYYYKITETVGNQGGITYDTTERRFNVVVADSDMDGDLEIISVNNQAGTTVTGKYTVTANFNNVYQPTGNDSVTIDVLKKMSGQHSLAGYQFALYDSSDIANADEIVRSSVTNSAGQASFTLNYAANRASMAGEVFTYYMAEINTGNPNINYSSAVYKVEVTVKDNGDGSITASSEITSVTGGAFENNVPTFTNTYVPSDSDFVTISGTKVINGDRVLNAGEFAFNIKADSTTPNAPMPSSTTVYNKADGSFAFPAIEFADSHKGNSYIYVISEVDDNVINGFTYDQAKFYVYIDVIDNGNQTLTAKINKIEKVTTNTQTVDDIIFTNAYDAADAKVTLKATKLLTGKVMQANEFEFELKAVTTNAPMPSEAKVKNDKNGGITFGEIIYDKAGTYVYTLTEVVGNDARYDYDKSVYEVTVTVTDNSRGVLTAEVSLVKNNMPSEEIVFHNGFVPTPIKFNIYDQFGGTKVLDGRPVAEGEFEFTLINAINGKQMGDSVKNDANAEFKFPEVQLDSAGIYHYKIVENVGDEKGVTYDTTSFHIRLEVIQENDGTLTINDKKLYKGTVTKEMVGGVLTEVTTYTEITSTESIEFKNSYKADPAHVTLEATKTLTGRDLIDGEFKFDLHKTESDFKYNNSTVIQDDVVLSLKNNGEGSVVFMPMLFENTGTYNYVIVEDELDEKGVTCDKTVYKVEITVTDNHKGDLVAAIKVDGQNIVGSTADTVKFHNTYEIAATEIVIKGNKTLTGRDLVENEFSFELYDEENVKLETVKNAKDGSFTFTAIPVSKAGKYVYTVRETKGNEKEITYDNTVYTVTADVTDNLDGTFKVVYTYTKGTEMADGVTFINVYTAPIPEPTPEKAPETKPESTPEQKPEKDTDTEVKSPKTGDNRNLWMWFALMFISGGFIFGSVKYFKNTEE